jgi:hypothetical protein
MIRWTRLLAVVAAMGIGGPALAATAAADYEIRLDRPIKVGAEYRVAVTGRYVAKSVTRLTETGPEVRVPPSPEARAGGARLAASVAAPRAHTAADDDVLKEVAETREFTVDFEAAVKVLGVTKKGSPNKVALTIGKCLVKEAGRERTPLARGTVVIGFVKDKEDVFEIEGKAVSEAADEALGLVISLGRDDLSSDDEVLGTKDRKKVGDKWDANAERIAKDFSIKAAPITKDDVKGWMKIAKVEKVGPVECLHLEGEIAMSKVPGPIPEGARLVKGSYVTRFVAKVPVDPAIHALEETDELTSVSVVRGRPAPDGPEVTVTLTLTRSLSIRWTFPNEGGEA